MTDFSELKKLAEDANREFPAKEDLWSMVCTPTVGLELIGQVERLSADNRSKNGSLAAYGKQISALQRAVKNRDKVLAKVSAERDTLKEETALLRRYLSDVHDSLQREYWCEYAGLNETRSILDMAMREENGHD